MNTANCLKTQGIVPYDTRDAQERSVLHVLQCISIAKVSLCDGGCRERFHPFTPGQHLSYRIPPNPDWYPKYNPHLKIGYDCCSDESISFHYVPVSFSFAFQLLSA